MLGAFRSGRVSLRPRPWPQSLPSSLPCQRPSRNSRARRRAPGRRENQGSRTNTEEGERRWDLWRNEAHSGCKRGRPTGPWRACSGVARSSRAGLGREKTSAARSSLPRQRHPPRRPRRSLSTWASWSGSPSSEIRASSATRSSRPRRSRSSESERRVRHRRENLRSAVMYWSAVGRPPKEGASYVPLASLLGLPVLIEELLYAPEHSLIDQSLHSRLGVETTNGDGFGLGWYTPHTETPAVFHSIEP